jgi:tRNA threonylcarbamoyladenosine biosynthesis protein TsaB
MVLYINTKDAKLIEVALKKEGQVVEKLADHNQFGSQVLLPLITKLLEKNKLEFKDLTGVEVETGPGSYTGLKVGVSVANALGFSLGILVNGKEIETELQYS